MADLCFNKGCYSSNNQHSSLFASHFPSVRVYLQMLQCIWLGSRKAHRNAFEPTDLKDLALRMLAALESAGVCFEIHGAQHFQTLPEPCVFVANHMSTLEALILPGLIQPAHAVTYILKKKLLHYPLVKDLLLATKAIAITQTEPKADLRRIMTTCSSLFEQNFSVIVFPEGRRNAVFRKQNFNTLGTKIARRHQVPIIPIALKTNAWPMGKRHPDISRIDPQQKVYFEFGPPIEVQGNGHAEHQHILTFIEARLRRWGAVIEG